jgi:hypothetical protein
LEAIARGAGFTRTATLTRDSELASLKREIVGGSGLYFATIKIAAEKLPLVFPHSFDGVTALNRFRAAVLLPR